MRFTQIRTDQYKKVERVTLYTLVMYTIFFPALIVLVVVLTPIGLLKVVLEMITVWEIEK